jgi:hypothetical protein
MFWSFLLLLFFCEFFIQHLQPPLAAPLCSWFRYNRCVYVSLHNLHGFNSTITLCASQVLHYNHYCITNSFVPTLSILLHCNVLALQFFLHYWFFYNMESNFFLQLVLFLIIVFLCFCRFFNFVIATTQTSRVWFCLIRMYTLFFFQVLFALFLMSICFFMQNLEFIFNLYLYGIGVCVVTTMNILL